MTSITKPDQISVPVDQIFTSFQEEAKDWTKKPLRDRFISAELAASIKENHPTAMLSEIGKSLKCAILGHQDFSSRMLRCIIQKEPGRRNTSCGRYSKNGEKPCIPLVEPSLTESEINEIANKKDYTLPAENKLPFSPVDTALVAQWFEARIKSYDRTLRPMPDQLNNHLLRLGGEGLQLFSNGKICEESKACSGNCPSCLDGVILGQWGSRYDYLPENTDYLVPQKIKTIYQGLGTNPADRLGTFTNIIKEI